MYQYEIVNSNNIENHCKSIRMAQIQKQWQQQIMVTIWRRFLVKQDRLFILG